MLSLNQGLRENIEYTTARETLDILSKKNLNLGKSEIISSFNKKGKDDSVERQLYSLKRAYNDFEARVDYIIESTYSVSNNNLFKMPYGPARPSLLQEAYNNMIDYIKTNIIKEYLTTSNQTFKDEVLNIVKSINPKMLNIRQAEFLLIDRMNQINAVREANGQPKLELSEAAENMIVSFTSLFEKITTTTNKVLELLNNNNMVKFKDLPGDIDKSLNNIIFTNV